MENQVYTSRILTELNEHIMEYEHVSLIHLILLTNAVMEQLSHMYSSERVYVCVQIEGRGR